MNEFESEFEESTELPMQIENCLLKVTCVVIDRQ